MPGMLTDGYFSRTRGTVAARGSSGGAEGTPSRLETQGSGSRTASEIPGPHKGDRGTVAARGSSGGAEGTPSPLRGSSSNPVPQAKFPRPHKGTGGISWWS